MLSRCQGGGSGLRLRLNKLNFVLALVVKVNLPSGFFQGFIKFLKETTIRNPAGSSPTI